MKQKTLKRSYKMRDADLVQLSDDIANTAERDATELLDYGITALEISNLRAARTAFAEKKSDNYYMTNVMLITENKNASRESILLKIKQISGRAKIKFGENSAEFRSFCTTEINKQTDNKLVRICRCVVNSATNLLAELASTGLTQTMIDDLAAQNNTFDTQLDLKIGLIVERDIAALDRIELGNALYTHISNICNYGKLCWEAKNEAKHNDYVVYKNAGTTPPQFETEGTVAAMSGTSTTVSGISDNTEITLKNKSDAPLQFFFAEDPTDISAPIMISINPKTKQKLTANALGFNYDKGFSRLNVFNPSNIEGDFSILWD